MRLFDYLLLLRRRIVLVAAVVAITCAGAVTFADGGSSSFEATARLRLRPLSPDSRLISLLGEVSSRSGVSSVGTEVELVRSDAVALQVSEVLGADPHVLIDQVTVEPVLLSEVLQIRAVDASESRAIQIANGFATSYVAVRRLQAAGAMRDAAERVQGRMERASQRVKNLDEQLFGLDPLGSAYDLTRTERDRANETLLALQDDYDLLNTPSVLDAGGGEIIESARTTAVTGSSGPMGAAILGLLVGIPLAVAFALVRDSLKEGSIATDRDVEDAADAEVLGHIPRDPQLAGRSRLAEGVDPRSPAAESYRILREVLTRRMHEHDARSILVTSAAPREGRSTTVAQLGLAFADIRQPTILIDADLRSPSLHLRLGAQREPGLADITPQHVPATRLLQPVRPDLELLAAGAPTDRPDLVLATLGVTDLLAVLSSGDADRAPITIIDAPPVLQAAEVTALASAVDGVVIVVRAGTSRATDVRRAAEQVRRAGGVLFGVILAEDETPKPAGRRATRETSVARRVPVATRP